MTWYKIIRPTESKENSQFRLVQALQDTLEQPFIAFRRTSMNEAYAVVAAPNGEKYALVFEFDTVRLTEVKFKVEDEFVGPYVANCPPEFLDMLEPLELRPETRFACKWRERCRENAAELAMLEG